MKTISQTYKDNIKQLGKEITYEITYDNTTLGDEDILNANLHYDGGILKSVMKQLDIELYNDIPIGTELTYKFGVKVDDTNYEMVDYGNFIVYSSEKLEDSNTYKLVCYDKMLYAMKDYEAFATYPITIRNYINALCNHLGLTFANTTDNFTNYDKTIENELYIDNEGNNIGYTYRDVLDELAQATASTICINDNDELEIRYITNTNEEKTSVSGTSLSMTAHDNKVDIDLLGNTTQETTTGKNLLKNDLATRTESGITITKNSDGTYKVNGTATADISLAINNDFVSMSGTWRMLGCPSGGSSTTYMLSAYVGYWGGGSPNIDTGSGTNITYTGNVKVRFYIKSGTTCNNLIFKPMLTTDTSATINDWEPYTYGASPNPNYPQPIETTTGRNVIEVCGKNLFNKNKDIVVGKGYSSDGSIINLAETFIQETYISVESNTKYTLSTTNNYVGTTNYRLVFMEYSSDKTFIQRTLDYTHTYNTITTTSNTKYIRICASNVAINDLQLEKGSTATTYEPYIGNNYEINLGKNLVSFENLTDATNFGVEISYNKSEIRLNGTTNQSGTFIPYTNLNIPLPAGTYTMSYRFGSGTASRGSGQDIAFILRDKNDNNLNTTTIGQILEASTGVKAQTFTLSNSTTLRFYAYCNNSDVVLNNIVMQVQLEKGSTATEYEPYFPPIELCKIGTYQDRLFKASGKNLYDIDSSLYGTISQSDGTTISTSTTILYTPNYINVVPSSQYTLSCSQTGISVRMFYYDSNKTYLNTAVLSVGGTSGSITIPSNAYYMRCQHNVSFTNMQLEKGSSATTYEPYGNNEWWLKKAINKVVLNGSESWYFTSNCCYTNNIVDVVKRPPNNTTKADIICDHYILDTLANCYNNVNDKRISVNNSGYLYIYDTSFTSANAIKTWLASNNTIVYYVLATPTYTKIENEELIEQLEHIRLINGYNNVISSSPITLDYVSGIDTIDEEYLKDINVNFGEMTKPINTITFKRSGDSDAISLSYPEDLEDDKKNEIAISDNQILNYDNRDEYLKGILDKLYGLTYCLNDYTSTGITYYDLCDRYEVSITRTDVDGNTLDTNFYPCIMFNDEINVNQGLQEIVHTERAEESITDYNTTTKTDRLKTRTDLIVNKQEGFIEAVTGSLQIGEDGQSEVVNGVVSRQTETESIINVITSFDENGNPTGVKTTKGFTFNEDGLNITSSDNTYKTQIDEQGTYYYDGDEILGQTTKEGSKFKNMDLYGEFHYGMDEITDTPLFVSMKFTDGSEECFGHFWNGS